MTSSVPSISVIIPTYNRAKMVADCVASVLATDYPALEIIVVDDCSPDDTQGEIVRRFGGDPRVQCLRNAKNSFQAVSRNRGAAAAKGDYFLFLDDDNLVHADILTELLKVFADHPQAGLVAPMAIHRRSGRESVIWSLGSDFNRWTSRPADFHPNLPLAELEAVTRQTTLPTTYYPNGFMVPRAAFAKVGGFDERYEQIFEESDFGWLLLEAGYKNFLSTTARTDHYGFLEPGCVPALRRLGIEKPYRTYCFARNRLRFARKHFTRLQALSVALVFAPLSVVYYGWVALKHRRPDIAWAYLKGTLAGTFGG
ncbi:MAG: glycosyltransferase family 2 protein [Kiritimatiellia bacterium]